MTVAAIPYTFVNGGGNADATQVMANLNAILTFLNSDVIQKDASVAFTQVPSGPATDPTTANQLTRKGYVDAKTWGTAAITDAAITTAKLADANVTAAKLADGSVTVNKIGDGQVTFAKVAAGAIDRTKMAAGSLPIITCTAGTRPAGPAVGQPIWETDTSRLRVWNGSGWALQNGLLGADWNGSGTVANGATATLPSTATYNPDSLWNTGTAVFTANEDGNYLVTVRFTGFNNSPAAGFGSTLNIAYSAGGYTHKFPIWQVVDYTISVMIPVPAGTQLTFTISNVTGMAVGYFYATNIRWMSR